MSRDDQVSCINAWVDILLDVYINLHYFIPVIYMHIYLQCTLYYAYNQVEYSRARYMNMEIMMTMMMMIGITRVIQDWHISISSINVFTRFILYTYTYLHI